MCWADKIGLFLAGLIVVFMAWATSVGDGPGANFTNMVSTDIVFIGYSALPIWLILRALDFLAGGPARRRGRIRVHLMP